MFYMPIANKCRCAKVELNFDMVCCTPKINNEVAVGLTTKRLTLAEFRIRVKIIWNSTENVEFRIRI
jgi:hypothetical protein